MIDRILVVDDSEVNRIVAATNLRDSGYEVELAESGKEALERLHLDKEDPAKKCPFDTVLLDVMMPEIDGLTVLGKNP